MTKPFTLQAAQRAPQVLRLVPDYMRAKVPVRAA